MVFFVTEDHMIPISVLDVLRNIRAFGKYSYPLYFRNLQPGRIGRAGGLHIIYSIGTYNAEELKEFQKASKTAN